MYSHSTVLNRGSQTLGPRAACGPRGPLVRPAMPFGNFQIINIHVVKSLDKKMPRKTWTNVECYPVLFSSRP